MDSSKKFNVGDRVRVIKAVHYVPAGTMGTIANELSFYDYQVEFDSPAFASPDGNGDSYAFYAKELELIPTALNVEEPVEESRTLTGLTVKDLITYYCQEMQITPEELIANFGNDEHNMNIMWGAHYGSPFNAYAEIRELYGSKVIVIRESEDEL